MEFILIAGWFGSAVEIRTSVDEWVRNGYGAHSPMNRDCGLGECFRSMRISKFFKARFIGTAPPMRGYRQL